jgi:hypothetical protein
VRGAADQNSSVSAYLDTAASLAVATVEVVQEGSTLPGLSPGSVLLGIFDVKINDAQQLLVTATVDDPNIPTSVDRAFYRWTTDATTGGIATIRDSESSRPCAEPRTATT